MGLLVGIELDDAESREAWRMLLRARLILTGRSIDRVIRLRAPLVIAEAEVDEGLGLLRRQSPSVAMSSRVFSLGRRAERSSSERRSLPRAALPPPADDGNERRWLDPRGRSRSSNERSTVLRRGTCSPVVGIWSHTAGSCLGLEVSEATLARRVARCDGAAHGLLLTTSTSARSAPNVLGDVLAS